LNATCDFGEVLIYLDNGVAVRYTPVSGQSDFAGEESEKFFDVMIRNSAAFP